MRRTYTAVARRSGGWWAIEILGGYEDGQGMWTQARTLDKVEYMARDALALIHEVPVDSFDVVVEPHIDEELQAEVTRARQLRGHAEVAQREAQEAMATAARDLATLKLPVRDIGLLLGVSFQRASQLIRRSA